MSVFKSQVLPSLVASLLALGAAANTHAATFTVTGARTANNSGVIYTPTAPSFGGALEIDAAGVLSAGSFQFEPYSDYASGGTYVVPAETLAYGSSTGSWNGNVLTFSGIATVDHMPGGSCTGTCFPAPDGATGTLSLVLTFSDAGHFTGIGNTFYTSSYGGYGTTLTFSGTAVPVPAAAWLFGSALFGLAGSKLRGRKPR